MTRAARPWKPVLTIRLGIGPQAGRCSISKAYLQAEQDDRQQRAAERNKQWQLLHLHASE